MGKDLELSRRSFLGAVGTGFAFASTPSLVLAKTGHDSFELRAETTRSKLVPGDYEKSNLWLYNGTNPGPEIRVKQGEKVRVRFINNLPEPTSIHWHGIRIDNSMDGVSGLTQDAVQPGESFDYEFTVPDAGTFWYHAHNKSWSQVARGLYGPLIVDELTPTFDSDHDFFLVLDDWQLAQDGSLNVESLGSFMEWSHAGRLGNWITVNGQSEPSFKLRTGEAYRLRLINASNARILQINPKAIGAKVIAYDGFAFAEPREPEGDILPITPAQRVDLLVNGEAEKTFAINDIGDFALQELSGKRALSLAKFSFIKSGRSAATPVVKLTHNDIATPNLATARRFDLVMSGGAMGRLGDVTHNGKPLNRGDMQRTKQVWAFNGVANVAEDPFFAVTQGETVIVKTVNETGWAHGMHVHGHHFQILTVNGQKRADQPWRDTYLIDRDETVEIAFVADNPGKWLFHCHMLEHAAAGMNTWFSVA